MKTIPLRWRFALWSLGLVTISVGVFAVGSFFHVYHEQVEAVDLEIKGEARRLLELHQLGLMDTDADALLANQPWLAFAHFGATGEIERRSSRLPETLARSALAAPAPQTLRTPDVGWRIASQTAGSETWVVAYDLSETYHILRELLVIYAALLPLILAGAVFGGRVIAGRVLTPVRELTQAVEAIQVTELSCRVPLPAMADELQQLARVFNAMLARLETGFEQARRFSADASHELRTPLTILRGQIERLLHTRDWPAEHEADLVSLQEEIARLDRITEHLLLLASFDAGRAALRMAAVNFSALTRDACEDAGILAEALGVTLRLDVPAEVGVWGDAHHLRRLLLNLLQNAVRHNHPGGEVICTVTRETERTVILRVTNTGPEIPAAAREHLFERFFRADPSRTQREGHGLGLALCREIVRAHHGEILLSPDTPVGWIEFMVRLPAESDSRFR